MSKAEYKENRRRVFEIRGLSPSDPNYSCHHAKIYRRDAKADPSLREGLDKIDNLYPLSNEQHKRLHKLEDETTGYVQPVGRRRKPKRRRHKKKR